MHDTILTNARLVLSTEVVAGSLSIVDGTIRAVDPGTTSVATAEDLEGDYLIPGLVELHTDHLESHFSPRPGVAWNPTAAVQSAGRPFAPVNASAWASVVSASVLAVNQEYVPLDSDVDVTPRDEVALIPPISGG